MMADSKKTVLLSQTQFLARYVYLVQPRFNSCFLCRCQSYFETSVSWFHQDGSCSLPLPFDDPLQPLYNGPPLPLCVLEAAGISADENGNYKGASPERMAKACRFMAAWKVAGNGENVRYPRRCLL